MADNSIDHDKEYDSMLCKGLPLDPPLPTHRLVLPPNENKRLFIVFYNGTFAPVHQGHIDVMLKALDYLQSLGSVVGAFFSPAAPHYAAGKLRTNRIALIHRMRMVELALNETRQKRSQQRGNQGPDPFDSVTVDTWEWSQGYYVDLLSTMAVFRRRVQRVPQLTGLNVRSRVPLHERFVSSLPPQLTLVPALALD